jgi:thiamine monophosphate synthase
VELHPDQGSEQEHKVQRICEALLVLPFFGAGGIQLFAIISNLELAVDGIAVGIAVMKQQFAGPIPPWIKVAERVRL